ncbi:hypothetical protein ACEN4P_09250 [Marinilactibacillus psychrotolerans]|uniref:hypothetical protein n=1 Tax=Marinilactibacillus psychrotolerans TaxID=191770 RepID=UPI00388A24BF
MPVIQVPMDISEKAIQGILTGNMIRTGGVVRDSTGQIVEHLRDVSESKSGKEGVIRSVLKSASKNKSTVAVGIATVAVIGSVAFWSVSKIRKNKTDETSLNEDLSKAINEYMSLAVQGKLNINAISNLKNILEEVRKLDGSSKIIISVKQLQELIGYISKYTQELAEANNFKIDCENKINNFDDTLLKLNSYLEIQENLFKEAA